MGGEYPGSLWIGTSHFWPGRNGQRAAWIIVHGTAGGSSAQEVAGWFQTNNPPTSVHYVVGRDGVIVQCVRENDSAWGNGVLSSGHASFWNPNINPNLQTISIEHVKSDPGNREGLTSAQQAASFRLIAYLCAKHHIPTHSADRTGGITGHFSIDPVNRSFCPGTFPWSELFKYLGSPSSKIPGGGTGGGTGGKHGGLAVTAESAQNAAASKATALARAPLSPGFLGIVEQVDEWEQLPDLSLVTLADRSSWVPWGLAYAEGVLARGAIVFIGLLIIVACVFNTMKGIVEQEAQVAGPLIGAAAGGTL